MLFAACLLLLLLRSLLGAQPWLGEDGGWDDCDMF